jgi:hypothetical protein
MKWNVREWSIDMISGQQGLNDEDTDVSDKVKFFWR